MVSRSLLGAPEVVLKTKVDRRTWSVMQYLEHLRQVLARAHELVDEALEGGSDLGRSTLPRPAQVSPDELQSLLGAIDQEAAHLHKRLADLETRQLDVGFNTRHVRWTVRSLTRAVIHEFVHHLADLTRIGHELGWVVNSTGRLSSIAAPCQAEPVLGMKTARIDRRGVVGDHAGVRSCCHRPWQALSLYAEEAIGSLRAEGHQVEPGALSENLTVSAVDWSLLRPGLLLKVGEVRCVLTLPVRPQTERAGRFVDGDISRIDDDRHPGWALWHASVLRPGVVAAGDEVVVTSYRPWY